MRVLVTGSSGHLGEALCRVLAADGVEAVGVDTLPSPYTTIVGSVADRPTVRRAIAGADAVVHAATLHKPHVGSDLRQEFVDTNVTGTVVLLEEAVAACVAGRVHEHDERVRARADATARHARGVDHRGRRAGSPQHLRRDQDRRGSNICEPAHRDHGLPIVILRTSRFFPEADVRDDFRVAYEDANLKVNELLNWARGPRGRRRASHRLALERAPELGFGRYIVSATPRRSRPPISRRCAWTRRPWWKAMCRPLARCTSGWDGAC